MGFFFLEIATSVPKRKKNMKDLNKKEAAGELLHAFTEVCVRPKCLSSINCIHHMSRG